jgi:hypothetical protein
LLASDHADRIALDGVAREALKHAAKRCVDHSRMNDDASDFSGLNNSRELRPLYCHGSDAISDARVQWVYKNCLERNDLKKFFLNLIWPDRAAWHALLSLGGCDNIFPL